MTGFPSIVETYLGDLRRIRASGGATAETSSYAPLENLFNAVGAGLKPKVFCVSATEADQGAGHPDFGLYAAKQVQRGGQPKEDQLPEHGVVEVKSAENDAWLTADSAQVSRYWSRYRLVLVTNYRDFLLVGEDANGNPARLESFRLADRRGRLPPASYRSRKPLRFGSGVGLGEYLRRVLSHRARLAEPRDLAELLASHARDALARVEAAEGDAGAGASPLATVRVALEEALGVQFKGERGVQFFRSTLVQTLFYGIFSAWVLWARQTRLRRPVRLTGMTAVWHLRAPVLRALFQQLSDPGRLQPLGLVEVLDWTAAALNRVEREAFFAKFSEGRGRALLLRAIPASLRSGAAQAVGRLVHAAGGGALHGGAGGPGAEGRPGHFRGFGRRERVCAGPVLRHRRVHSRDAAADCRQPARSRAWGR